ncbi:MAG: hypothetical protein AB8B81_08090 [Halioglobus sp.]
MKSELAQEIIDCLPGERTLFRYYKDYYAVCLLRRELLKHSEITIPKIRKGHLGKLLSKPVFADLLAKSGSGKIDVFDLDGLWPDDFESYVLTLGTWGHSQTKKYRYYQVSRPGKNLVLQMNFCRRHDAMYRRCVSDDLEYFQFFGHPISRRYCTLAWARIDLDLDTGEALIEEIQSDWLREIDSLAEYIKCYVGNRRRKFRYAGWVLNVDKVLNYLEGEVDRHRVIWSEAMLSASISFLRDEIGISRIYYHTPDTGAVLKNIHYSKPPRSIYTKLPKQFCFELVNEAPEFLAKDKQAKRRLKVMKDPQWFCMAA